MAESQNKTDAAAEQVSADATERGEKDGVNLSAIEKAVETDHAETVKATAVADAIAAEPTEKADEATGRKAKERKASARKVSAKKATSRKSDGRKPYIKPTGTSTPTIAQLKDKIMENTSTTDFAGTVKQTAAEAQSRMKAAYEKGSEMTSEVVEFQKGNLEAMVTSGKLLANGMQDMGRIYMEDAKLAAETVTDDVKKMAAVKSPTELFQLQGEMMRRNFDAAVARASRNVELTTKLVNEAFAPLSSRASIAAERISKVAA
ncbi:phasin family protein [Qipengyuania spongiae]|uniref:TIGR01841 family phasin n=1 Tax=Qipengyuania spongiae TaxID=2909673 RepID=A0ABY5T217_9SPHN|nr:TIGR01841 family phasin [Qipengyuania spongiae]UVI40559.1 TIGR01841 family phasin [Qipengyuania spongiae]